MARVLECDIGNSSCKWRVVDSSLSVLARGAFFHKDGFSGLPDLDKITRIRIANVAGQPVVDRLLAQLQPGGIEPEFAKTAKNAVGVVNTYADYSRLGIDRWLAAIAAHKDCNNAALVIDVGSALNVELISSAGDYLGGYIAPGADMMRRVLLADTGLVRFDSAGAGDHLVFGQTTQVAVNSGITAALVGASQIAIEEAQKRLGEQVSVFVTGGGSASIIDRLGHDVADRPDLVLDGLRWVLP